MGARQCVPRRMICPPLAPGVCMWGRRTRRYLLGQERMALQAMSRADVALGNQAVTAYRCGLLAGDMFNLASFSEVVDAVFATIPLP